MERGLLWLPLLAIFIGLAWTGWKEYQKVEAYQAWAAHFDRAKYDIYSVLGQKSDHITWGVPTPKGPIQLETIALPNVQAVQLWVDHQTYEPEQAPTQGRKVGLVLQLVDRTVQTEGDRRTGGGPQAAGVPSHDRL